MGSQGGSLSEMLSRPLFQPSGFFFKLLLFFFLHFMEVPLVECSGRSFMGIRMLCGHP